MYMALNVFTVTEDAFDKVIETLMEGIGKVRAGK